MADTERLEATGSRGEACIIVRTWSALAASCAGDQSDHRGRPSYRLATGERLQTTDAPSVFETVDGLRRFTLRAAP